MSDGVSQKVIDEVVESLVVVRMAESGTGQIRSLAALALHAVAAGAMYAEHFLASFEIRLGHRIDRRLGMPHSADKDDSEHGGQA